MKAHFYIGTGTQMVEVIVQDAYEPSKKKTANEQDELLAISNFLQDSVDKRGPISWVESKDTSVKP